MQTLEELIAASPVFAGLSPAHLELIAGCGANEHFGAGAQLFREGAPADRFFLIREGAVALEVDAPGRGALVIETLHAGRGGRLVVAVRALPVAVRRARERADARRRVRRRLPARQVRGRPRARLPADAALRGDL